MLHVLPWVMMGGVERRRVTLARLLGGDFEQRIACLSASGEIYQQLLDDHVQMHQLGTGGEGIANPLLHLRLHRLIRHFRPQILHGAIFEGMTWGALGGLLQRTPVVLLEETSHPNGTAPESMRRSPRGRCGGPVLCKTGFRGICRRGSSDWRVPHPGGWRPELPRARHPEWNPIVSMSQVRRPSARNDSVSDFREGTFVLGAVGRIP